MGLLVVEKRLKDGTSHKLEATIGLMASGSPYFPVMFGQTNDSSIMEFIGDPATQHPGSTLHALLKSNEKLPWSAYGTQIVSAFSVLHMKSILHNDIHLKNVIVHPCTNLVKVVDFGMACLQSTNRRYTE